MLLGAPPPPITGTYGRRLDVKRMSIRGIAHLLGVSPAAVSLALHGSHRVSEETKRHVRQVAKNLGYKPNPKLAELMSQMRLSRHQPADACLGVISFYQSARPWENSMYLAGIYEGMSERADSLGYRLEPFWLRAPGMTYRRLCSILDTRGISGLLCLGSPEMDVELPEEFERYAVVTHGISIRTPLHRVIAASFSDIWKAMNQVHGRGYRRPGLVVSEYEDVRSGCSYSSGYLGWCQHTFGTSGSIPILPLNTVEKTLLVNWIGQHHPDVVIFVHHHTTLPKFSAVLCDAGIRPGVDIGVAVLTQSLDGTSFSGLQQNRRLIGLRTVDLLVASIMNRERGIPADPRIQIVESRWIDGNSLR
ncbi:MAG: LacI family DNA-binding transcriptional regulator [Verrucomicrobia bacterium]|nr:LacI family DNA-binding transcriptional regulator [Verrucomicrobiota bacterium]